MALSAQRTWVIDPHSGGVAVPERTRRSTVQRIEKHAKKHYAGKYARLDFRFRGPLCYVDAYVEPQAPSKALLKSTGETPAQFLERLRAVPVHLCRLRHFAQDRWSMAFFSYSDERYHPSVLGDGSFFGTPEEAFDVGAVHLI